MSNYQFSNIKPEAALGYWIGDSFYPVYHGSNDEMIYKRNVIQRFELTKMENGAPVTRRHLAAVVPYGMTI